MLSIKDVENSVVSTSDFNRHSSVYLKEIRESSQPLFVNRSNKVEAVLLSPRSYEKLIEQVERAEALNIALEVQIGRNSGEDVDFMDERVQALLV